MTLPPSDTMALGTVEIVALVVFGVLILGLTRFRNARNVGLAKGEYQKAVSEVTAPSKAEHDMDRGGMTAEVDMESE